MVRGPELLEQARRGEKSGCWACLARFATELVLSRFFEGCNLFVFMGRFEVCFVSALLSTKA
jgi:hypothetical protein